MESIQPFRVFSGIEDDDFVFPTTQDDAKFMLFKAIEFTEFVKYLIKSPNNFNHEILQKQIKLVSLRKEQLEIFIISCGGDIDYDNLPKFNFSIIDGEDFIIPDSVEEIRELYIFSIYYLYKAYYTLDTLNGDEKDDFRKKILRVMGRSVELSFFR